MINTPKIWTVNIKNKYGNYILKVYYCEIIWVRLERKIICNVILFESQNQKIIEYQVGRDIKDHLVQPFLAKAHSRIGGLASCPDTLKSAPYWEFTSSLGRLFQLMIVLIVKNFPFLSSQNLSMS